MGAARGGNGQDDPASHGHDPIIAHVGIRPGGDSKAENNAIVGSMFMQRQPDTIHPETSLSLFRNIYDLDGDLIRMSDVSVYGTD